MIGFSDRYNYRYTDSHIVWYIDIIIHIDRNTYRQSYRLIDRYNYSYR